MDERRYLTRRQVADELGLAVETLAAWAKRGRGPRFSRSGPVRGRVWYSREDVAAWLADRRVVPGGSRHPASVLGG